MVGVDVERETLVEACCCGLSSDLKRRGDRLIIGHWPGVAGMSEAVRDDVRFAQLLLVRWLSARGNSVE